MLSQSLHTRKKPHIEKIVGIIGVLAPRDAAAEDDRDHVTMTQLDLDHVTDRSKIEDCN